MDKAAVLADLCSLSVQNWDVEAYTTKFNKVAPCLEMAPGDELLIKQVYLNNLPFNMRKHILLDCEFP